MFSQVSKPQAQLMSAQASKLNVLINRDHKTLASWLFLIGSLIFLLDGVLENLRGGSFSSVLHLIASIVFTIGSVLFMPNHLSEE
jgi:hypothetical protein